MRRFKHLHWGTTLRLVLSAAVLAGAQDFLNCTG